MQFGATHALDPNAEGFDDRLRAVLGGGADIALELAGRAETAAHCLACVRIGGVVVLAGTVSPVPAVPLDPQAFVRRMLTLRGVHNYQPRHLRIALDFLAGAGQKFPLASLIAASYPLDRIEEAFAAALENKGRRIAVTPHQEP
jgi:alcohol dehydrogenase